MPRSLDTGRVGRDYCIHAVLAYATKRHQLLPIVCATVDLGRYAVNRGTLLRLRIILRYVKSVPGELRYRIWRAGSGNFSLHVIKMEIYQYIVFRLHPTALLSHCLAYLHLNTTTYPCSETTEVSPPPASPTGAAQRTGKKRDRPGNTLAWHEFLHGEHPQSRVVELWQHRTKDNLEARNGACLMLNSNFSWS